MFGKGWKYFGGVKPRGSQIELPLLSPDNWTSRLFSLRLLLKGIVCQTKMTPFFHLEERSAGETTKDSTKWTSNIV
ncbi:hypothetical protein CEXT_582931 [Caerostris extrusa]|uniref:Ycf15 n=1 Tax=Caerostris extrusa TaxID=172846 RepID=A0AAV4RJA2_CAEEX|nr:hypothetical protein CEXT_582931 [Caerostris extrusa]